VLFLPLGGVLADIDCRVPFLIYTGSVLLLPAMVLSLPEPSRATATGNRPTSIAALRRTLSRLPLKTLALVEQVIFYMIPVQGPFYIESQTGATATFVGIALGVPTLAGGLVSTVFGRTRASSPLWHSPLRS
jgi:hypothetical protein